MPMYIIFQIWSELICRKCYFHKLSAFKMNPKNMFICFASVSHILLLHFVLWFYFFYMNNFEVLLNILRMERPTALSLGLRVGRELVSSLRSMCDLLYDPGKLVACELVTEAVGNYMR